MNDVEAGFMKRVVVLVTTVFLVFSLAFLMCGKKKTEQQYYNQALDYQQNEDYEKAAETFMAIYKRFPNSTRGAEALFQAALIQANLLAQFDRAIDTHQRLIRAFPDDNYVQNSLFMIGYVYANEKKDYKKAEETYSQFLDKYPDHDLASSVKWELDNLGKDINEIKFLTEDQQDTSGTK